MRISQEVRDFDAKKNAPIESFVAAEEAEQGMKAMSETFKEKGGELYLKAD